MMRVKLIESVMSRWCKKELYVSRVAVFIQIVDAVGIEERCTTFDAVDHVAFVQQ